jgi:hypothetical protein
MINFQKIGGFAALYEAVAYLVAILLFIFVLNYPSIVEPAENVALLVDNQATMYIMHLLVYVVFGIFLVILNLALYDLLKTSARTIMQTATALGIIWAGVLIASGMVFNAGMARVVDLYSKDPAQAVSVWLAIESVSNGLSSANGEILGGLWTFLVSWAALRGREFPKALNYLGMVVGVVGLISVVPILRDITSVFGIGQIVWFVWLGSILLRNKPGTLT